MDRSGAPGGAPQDGGVAATEAEDHELMARVKARDEQAFAQLVARHSPGVGRYLRSMVREAELALDLTQETFLKIWLNAASFEPRGPFRAWLYRVARNAAISDMRKQRVRDFFGIAPRRDEGEPAEPLWPGRGPELETLDRELGVRLRREIARLPVKLREAFVLAAVEELSMAEVARITRSPEGTVKARVHRARQRLRTALTAAEGRVALGRVAAPAATKMEGL